MEKPKARKGYVTLTVTLITLMIVSYACIFNVQAQSEPTEPHPEDTMWIEPSNKTLDIRTIEPGYRFNVTVWVNVSVPSYSWQAVLIFNSSCFNVTNSGFTGASGSQFFTGLMSMPTPPLVDSINATHDYFGAAETLLTAGPRDPGYGSLCWVEFNVTKLPPVNQQIIKLATVEDLQFCSQILDFDLEEIPMDAMWVDLPVVPEFSQLIMLLIATIASTATVILTKKLK